MSILVKIAAALTNFFSAWEKAARPIWEFRIRYSIEKRGWVIELHENGDRVWRPLTKLGPETEHELHVSKFDDFNEAEKYAVGLGLHRAYEESFYTRDRKRLHPAANAIDRAVLEASADTMGGHFPKRGDTPLLRQVKH